MTTEESHEGLKKIPVHIAMIMDGNGRWAAARGLPRVAGHKAGTENLRQIISGCGEYGIKYLTIFAFSTENWGRPKEEVQGLMAILADVIDRELEALHKEGVQLRHLGHLEGLPEELRSKVLKAIKLTANNEKLVVNVAFNYGGRDEIICAVKQVIKNGHSPDEVDVTLISKYLFTAGIPDPDLIVRTSGEMRISNFLLWQAAYSEWYVTPTYWPDFDKNELRKALEEFNQRQRRFGKLNSDSEDRN